MGAKASHLPVVFEKRSNESSNEGSAFQTTKNQSHNSRSASKHYSAVKNPLNYKNALNDLGDPDANMTYRNRGDETNIEESRYNKTSSKIINEAVKSSCRRPSRFQDNDRYSPDHGNESETSSTLFFVNRNGETFLKKRVQQRENKPAKEEVASISSGDRTHISQLMSSSSTGSFVERLKSRRMTSERSVSQQHEQVNASEKMASTVTMNNESVDRVAECISSMYGNNISSQIRDSNDKMLKKNTCDVDESTGQWLPLKPSPKLGFTETNAGDIIFTAYLRMKGTRPDEYASIKKICQRRIKGLESQYDCKIKFTDEPFEQRTRMVHKLRIHGPGYREVVSCKNSLPKCVIERLITANDSMDEVLLKPQRRK
ncbi:hypothetical protein Aperf_G00000132904 [Anoplocephala perfoliata]